MGRTFAVAVVASAFVAACSSTKLVDGPPAAGSYTIKFPSTAAAVATETVQVFVFGGDAGAQTCLSLIQAESHQALPPALVSSSPTTPCDLLAGSAALQISFGHVTVLAVAARKGADFLVGCVETDISEDVPSVSIDVTLASTSVSVPLTVCTGLSSHCNGNCS